MQNSPACSPESRTAVVAAIDILGKLINADLGQVALGRRPLDSHAYLPPSWRVGLDIDFMTKLTNSLSVVKAGLGDVGWEGPANTAEALCLNVVLEYAVRVVPEIAQVKDLDRVGDDILYLQGMGFQDVDHKFLIERETTQPLPRHDAFKPFANR